MPVSRRRVHGRGPLDASIAYIGEGPGADEDRSLRAFTGTSGKVLWEMSRDYAGVEREGIYVDNLSPFRLTDARGKDRAPTPEEFAQFAPDLRRRLKLLPGLSLIVTLGRFSTAAILRQPVTMEACHGLLFYDRRGRAVIPSYHPAAGLHDPTLLAFTANDLQQVGKYLRGEEVLEAPEDNWPDPIYSEITGTPELKIDMGPEIAIDTEYDPVTGEPWCLTASDTKGEAILIRADDKLAIAAFKRCLEFNTPTVIFHNALADITPLRRMGIDVIALGLKFRDTMIELFLGQLYPRSLKQSARRLCGVEMKEYEDVVGPVAEKFARDYLLDSISEPPGEWGIGEGRKHSVLKRIESLLYPRKNTDDGGKTIREKWADKGFAPIRKEIERVRGEMWRPTYSDMPQPEFRDYACRDADTTGRQASPLRTLISDLGLREVHTVDHGVVPIVERMQTVGMRVDVRRLDELKEYVEGELDAYLEICKILTGKEEFNPGSGDQVAAFCREQKLGLEKLTRSRKREQVDENALIAIRYSHPAIEPILTYRELQKLLGTYIEPLYGLLVGRGRYRTLYGNFRLTSAITGRLAMFDPNLMAFPTRTEIGRRIRRCFVARPGKRLGSCDLSQIELRVGAGLSQDPRMMDSFAQGRDLHLDTAMSMFGIKKKEDVDEKLHRYPAKTTNFAMFFGATGRRLLAEFLKAGIPGWVEEIDPDNPEHEGKQSTNDFVGRWFRLYAGVRDWIAATIRSGAAAGFVTTAAGRRRYLPALRFGRTDYPFNRLREEAERHASNFPVQGTAQEIEKRGMKVAWDEVFPAVHAAGYYFEPILQIHDDLMTEFDEDAEPLVKDLMLEAMTRESPWRGVPIKASWKSGLDWGSLE